MSRSNFVIDYQKSVGLPEKAADLIQSILNTNINKNDGIIVFEFGQGTFCLLRAGAKTRTDNTKTLYDQAKEEEKQGILEYRGHITFVSHHTDEDPNEKSFKTLTFSYFLVMEGQYMFSEVIRNTAVYEIKKSIGPGYY